jgi:anti-anti-sigma factor
MNVHLSFDKQENIIILKLSGRFLGKEGEDVIKEIDDYLEGQTDIKLVIDLGKLEYIGSQGAATLIMLSEKYPIKIAAAGQLVKNTLILLKINSIVEIYDTVEQAINSFKNA